MCAIKNKTYRFVLLSHANDLTGLDLGLIVFGLGLKTVFWYLVSVLVSLCSSLINKPGPYCWWKAVCQYVNEDGTNHNHCMQTFV